MRLTLWSVSVVILILGAVTLGTYALVRGRLESLDRMRLDEDYETVASLIRNSGGDVYDLAHIRDAVAFRLVLPDGSDYTSTIWEGTPLPQPGDGGVEPAAGVWPAPDGGVYRLRVGSVPEFDFHMVVARDVTTTVESVRSLSIILMAGLPVALILAVAGGYFLAGRALAPIEVMTRKAEEITADRLSERLPVAHPEDEIGRLATVFNETLGRLERAFERLRRFTADASHELRTPLTAIRSVGEVAMRDARDTAACREAIGSMLEETDRLTRLTDSLLTLARGDTGRAQLAPESIDLTTLVGGVVEELRVLAEEKRQTLVLNGGSSIVAVVDPGILRQAVSNVLHNAIRFAPEAGRVEVTVARSGSDQAMIEVSDNGPGVPTQERERVFERFYRVDKARVSSSDGGAGLGLSIARWAVASNGGSIEFRDREGPGVCCRISLPIERARVTRPTS